MKNNIQVNKNELIAGKWGEIYIKDLLRSLYRNKSLSDMSTK